MFSPAPSHVHSLLKPDTAAAEIAHLGEVAVGYGSAGVAIMRRWRQAGMPA